MKTERYSQKDIRWANDKIGQSDKTLAKWGCALVSLCNGANAVTGTNILPQTLAHNVACFLLSGDIIWSRACEFIRTVKFTGREDGENLEHIKAALRDPERFVILQVNAGAHFVLGWNYSIFGKMTCLDPWTGKTCDVKKVYKNIVGARYFAKI